MKLLESNEVIQTADDGRLMNEFTVGKRDGILEGCEIFHTKQIIGINAGTFILKGSRVKFDNGEILHDFNTTFPSNLTKFNIILEIVNSMDYHSAEIYYAEGNFTPSYDEEISELALIEFYADSEGIKLETVKNNMKKIIPPKTSNSEEYEVVNLEISDISFIGETRFSNLKSIGIPNLDDECILEIISKPISKNIAEKIIEKIIKVGILMYYPVLNHNDRSGSSHKKSRFGFMVTANDTKHMRVKLKYILEIDSSNLFSNDYGFFIKYKIDLKEFDNARINPFYNELDKKLDLVPLIVNRHNDIIDEVSKIVRQNNTFAVNNINKQYKLVYRDKDPLIVHGRTSWKFDVSMRNRNTGFSVAFRNPKTYRTIGYKITDDINLLTTPESFKSKYEHLNRNVNFNPFIEKKCLFKERQFKLGNQVCAISIGGTSYKAVSVERIKFGFVILNDNLSINNKLTKYRFKKSDIILKNRFHIIRNGVLISQCQLLKDKMKEIDYL